MKAVAKETAADCTLRLLIFPEPGKVARQLGLKYYSSLVPILPSIFSLSFHSCDFQTLGIAFKANSPTALDSDLLLQIYSFFLPEEIVSGSLRQINILQSLSFLQAFSLLCLQVDFSVQCNHR